MAAVIATERRLRTRMPGREPVVQKVVKWRTVRGYGPRPSADHVVFTKPRMPSRPALASLFARLWAPPFTLTAVAARRSPTDNPPVGLRPIPRNARRPDPYCSSGFRLTQQSGAWSAAAPSSLRSGGAAVFPVTTRKPIHRLKHTHFECALPGRPFRSCLFVPHVCSILGTRAQNGNSFVNLEN